MRESHNTGLRFGWVRLLHRTARVCLLALMCASCDDVRDGKYVVVIDPGHGGANIGAVTRDGLREKDLTLDVGLRLQELLSQRLDVRVVLTRTEDRALGLWDRRDASNHNRADFLFRSTSTGPQQGGESHRSLLLKQSESGTGRAFRRRGVIGRRLSGRIGTEGGLDRPMEEPCTSGRSTRGSIVLVAPYGE